MGAQVYLGCVIPNFIGTEFRILDHRVNPRSPEIMDFVSDKGKNELGAVVFHMNVMGRQDAKWKMEYSRTETCNVGSHHA